MIGRDRSGEHGPTEIVDFDSHPRLVVFGILLMLSLLVGGVVAFASSLGDSGSTGVSQVVVPRAAGRAAADAQAQFERLGLIVEIAYESNELIAAGTVVSQDPIAGSRLEVGQLVTLAVSDGPAGTEVPNVSGLHGSEAAGLLQTVGLVAKGEDVFNDDVRAGEAIGSNPPAGSRAAPGDTVVVKVSKGPAPRTVPQIVGISDAEAMLSIARAELKIGKVSHKTGTGQPNGSVISSSPAPGAEVPRNMPVNLVIAKDPSPTITPDLVGLNSSVAAQVARDAGVKLTTRTEAVPMGDSRDGLVIGQSPVSGTPIGAGESVTIQVASAPPPPTTVPPTTAPPPPGSTPPGNGG
ncbi:MAG TPA: PASTA domain-containing protein [Microthrixaceae bacterium]|nr:PASTA domain-containing protein [Microthrixaceae bacterium]